MANDNQTVRLRVSSVDRVEKYNPGTPLDGPPDEITEAEGPDNLASEVYPELAEGIKRVERRETWRKLLGVALTVGLALATGIPLGAPLMAGGLTTVGGGLIADMIIGGGTYTAYNAANAYLGVGDSSTAFAVGQTDLQGTNKARVVQDGGYPSRATNVITFRATFGSSVGNFVSGWLENGIFNHTSAGQMLTRKVVNLGIKVSGATWIFTKTLTITTG